MLTSLEVPAFSPLSCPCDSISAITGECLNCGERVSMARWLDLRRHAPDYKEFRRRNVEIDIEHTKSMIIYYQDDLKKLEQELESLK